MHRVLLVAAVAVALQACSRATSMAGGRVYDLSSVDTQPQLIGCSTFSPVSDPRNVRARITVEYVVLPDGSVDPTSVRPRAGRRRFDDHRVLDRALGDARSCSWKPGLVAERAVPTRVSHTFGYSVL